MSVVYGAANSASGFLRRDTCSRGFAAEAPVQELNGALTSSFHLDDDAFDVLAQQCGIRTVEELMSADAKDVAERVPSAAPRAVVASFIAAAKAHLAKRSSMASALGLDVETQVAGDNLGTGLSALAQIARRAALRAADAEPPTRVPAIVSLHDVALALSESDGKDGALHTRYLQELIPSLVRWQLGAPNETDAALITHHVAAAVDYCLEVAGGSPGAPFLPPESLREWTGALADTPIARGTSITTNALNEDPVVPIAAANGESFRRAVDGQLAFADLKRQLSDRIDTLRDESGHLPGGIAWCVRGTLDALAEVRVVAGDNGREAAALPESARAWIDDQQLRFVRSGGLGRASGTLERGFTIWSPTFSTKFAPLPAEEKLAPGPYRRFRSPPPQARYSGFELGIEQFAFNGLPAEFVIVQAEEDDNGQLTSFSAIFRLADTDICGWVAYERPDASGARP